MISDNNNVVETVINNTVTGRCTVDTGTYNSVIDLGFVNRYRFKIVPLSSGETRSYLAAGGARVKVIGITYLSLGFRDENFSFSFHVIDKLTPGILLGMGFILKYHCVPYLIEDIFTLRNSLISVPMWVDGSGSGLTNSREKVNFKRRP